LRELYGELPELARFGELILRGFPEEPADGAPGSLTGSITQGGNGLPSAVSLARTALAGN